jgi:hypothetical protein
VAVTGGIEFEDIEWEMVRVSARSPEPGILIITWRLIPNTIHATGPSFIG